MSDSTIDPTEGPNSSGQPPVGPSGNVNQPGDSSSDPSDYSNASANFFPDMPMTKKEFTQFMNGLLKLITAEIQNDRDKMKEASDKLKKSELGEDDS